METKQLPQQIRYLDSGLRRRPLGQNASIIPIFPNEWCIRLHLADTIHAVHDG
jgi:hypothetical protein